MSDAAEEWRKAKYKFSREQVDRAINTVLNAIRVEMQKSPVMHNASNDIADFGWKAYMKWLDKPESKW